ncbi:MAG: hypothetical protein WC879_03590 [Melioribacteraceae bacterium]
MKLPIEQFNEKVIAISKLLDGLTIDDAKNVLAETKVRIEECHIVNAETIEEYSSALINSEHS